MNCGPPTRAAQLPLDAAATASTAVCGETSGRVVRATVQSAVYGGPVPISVYMPPCAAAAHGPLPVIYLLHGGNADETQWPDLRVQPEADALIAHGAALFIVIMPGGDYRMHLDYAAFVMTDLLPAAERQFHVSATRSGRAIGGISLGGYWALKIAFGHPQLFAAAGGHSPVVNRGQVDDPLALAHTAQSLSGLSITLDVGDADTLRAGTERLARALQDRGVAVSLTVHPGQHNRVYWRSQTGDYLRFYRDALKEAQENTSIPEGGAAMPPDASRIDERFCF